MAILRHDNPRGASESKVEMSIEEFKKWISKFDSDKDGKITMEELREAIRANGGWFSTMKARRGIKLADKNSNEAIDDNEIGNLMEFAKKHLEFSYDIKKVTRMIWCQHDDVPLG
ncbi:hypothetical protein ACJIZ3_024983 [Penstemon smallii]|uniref:EF-hand domain-containing protein n=1 Tax=Penstemon smallii TaxID=265156 RepID=A0ABD3TTH7_9LAMI